jgi:hypothetical protein
VQREPRRRGIVHRHELDAAVHEVRQEGHVPGQAVEARDDQTGTGELALLKCCAKSRPVRLLATLDFDVFANAELPRAAVQVAGDGLALRLKAEARPALFGGGDTRGRRRSDPKSYVGVQSMSVGRKPTGRQRRAVMSIANRWFVLNACLAPQRVRPGGILRVRSRYRERPHGWMPAARHGLWYDLASFNLLIFRGLVRLACVFPQGSSTRHCRRRAASMNASRSASS